MVRHYSEMCFPKVSLLQHPKCVIKITCPNIYYVLALLEVLPLVNYKKIVITGLSVKSGPAVLHHSTLVTYVYIYIIVH